MPRVRKYIKKAYKPKKTYKKAYKKNSSFSNPFSAPVARTSQYVATKPVMKNLRDGGVCIRHTERIGTVSTAGTSFVLANSVSIQPGLASSFPWLSSIAQRFESYKFKRLRFFYKTKCSTTSVGDVTLACDYDNNDAAPTSTVQLENWGASANGSPWQNIELVCRYGDINKRKTYFVRQYPLAANDNLLLYDTGIFYCAVENLNLLSMGYIYVEYDIELMTPILNNTYLAVGGLVTGVTNLSANCPLGTGGSVDAQAQGITYAGIAATSSLVTIAAQGTFLITFFCSAGAGISAPIVSIVAGAPLGAISPIQQASGTPASSVCFTYQITTTSSSVTLQFQVTGTPTSSSVAISAVPPNSLA